MLVLSRREGQQIVVPQCQLTVTVLGITRRQVRVGITAPVSVSVRRAEILKRGHTGPTAAKGDR